MTFDYPINVLRRECKQVRADLMREDKKWLAVGAHLLPELTRLITLSSDSSVPMLPGDIFTLCGNHHSSH